MIDPERVMQLYEAGEITRDQFLRTLKISATEAKNVLGGDQVADFTVTTVGKTLDIRITSLPIENLKDSYVLENSNIKKRVKRRLFGGGAKAENKTVSNPRRKRRIKARTSK
jgi:hypothetical protein